MNTEYKYYQFGSIRTHEYSRERVFVLMSTAESEYSYFGRISNTHTPTRRLSGRRARRGRAAGRALYFYYTSLLLALSSLTHYTTYYLLSLKTLQEEQKNTGYDRLTSGHT